MGGLDHFVLVCFINWRIKLLNHGVFSHTIRVFQQMGYIYYTCTNDSEPITYQNQLQFTRI